LGLDPSSTSGWRDGVGEGTLGRPAFLLWLGICAIQDYHTGRISNWLPLSALFLGLAVRFTGWMIAAGSGITLVR
jgi:Flp pilus assembly protein protease CpaA